MPPIESVRVFNSKINVHKGENLGHGLAVIIDHMPTKQADVISLSDDIRAAVQAWGQKPEPEYNSGDKCPACDGRIALMEEVIGEAQMDDEPYTSGIQEGDRGEYHQLQDTILISLLVCDQCGKVFSKHFED